jgi:enamine deaminase RidA (YjgF/YER057c/UK114 family)
MTLRSIQPEGWPAPRGYANGILGRGRVLYVGGQIGWDTAGWFAKGFLDQFEQALSNFVAVVEAAGGTSENVAQMTIYVTDLSAYRKAIPDLGPVWRRHMGRHYPAMALVGVAGLVEQKAMIEIEGHAVLPDTDEED